MSRFRKLSQTVWHCQYHIVWTPKYRFKILKGEVAEEVEECVRTFCSQQKCEIIELNVQVDHMHLLVLIPPKISVSKLMGIVKSLQGCIPSPLGRSMLFGIPRCLRRGSSLSIQGCWAMNFILC